MATSTTSSAAPGRAAAWMLLTSTCAALIGCGGGSSSAPPAAPPPPPAPTLAASASATDTVAGGSTVSLQAAATNANGPVTWTLVGPGQLSAGTGNSITYTPPAADAVDTDTTVKITAAAGGLTQTVPLAVAEQRGRTWDTALYPKTNWTEAVYLADGRYVVTGLSGTILSSADLAHWTYSYLGTADVIQAIAAGGPKSYVAVGSSGFVAHSTDARTWAAGARVTDADGNPIELTGVAYTGSRYVAAGNGVYVSTDGVTWKSANRSGYSYQVAAANGIFVLVGSDQFSYSTDGITWKPVTCDPVCYGQQTVAWGNGRFVVPTATGTYTSVNGINWTFVSSSPLPWGTLKFTNGHFFLLSFDTINVSTDGYTWSQLPETANGGWTSIAGGPAGYVLVGSANSPQVSTDLQQWKAASTQPSIDLRHVDYMSGVYVALGYDGTLLRSTNGTDWRAVDADSKFDPIRFLSHGNGKFLGLGYYTLYTSSDGQQWTAGKPIRTDTTLGAVAYGNGLYVIVGGNGLILTSPDATTWTAVPSGITGVGAGTAYLGNVTYGGGKFVATAYPGAFLSSDDGSTWKLGASVGGTLTSIAYGAQGYVATSEDGLIWQSTDGVSWHGADADVDAKLPYGLQQVTYANGQYLAVGNSGRMLASTDSVHWTARSSAVGVSLYGVTYGNGSFVAVGDAGTILVSSH